MSELRVVEVAHESVAHARRELLRLAELGMPQIGEAKVHYPAIDLVDVARHEPEALEVGDGSGDAGLVAAGLRQEVALSRCAVAIENQEQSEVAPGQMKGGKRGVESLSRVPMRLAKQEAELRNSVSHLAILPLPC